jgi:hypothetical protein
MNSVIYGRFWAVISLMLLGCTLHTNAQQYYKWVDANGVTTYSATPPPTQRSNEPQLASQKNMRLITIRLNQTILNPMQLSLMNITAPTNKITSKLRNLLPLKKKMQLQ